MILNPLNNKYEIINEPPKIPFIHEKDLLKKCPKLPGDNELD